ncbi:NAD-dependent epimerase/dehydratase family protein [Patescibacteria group bacterium]
MKKALITGSGGFIGSHLKKVLEKDRVEVIEFSLEKGQQITNPKDFIKLPKVDVVFHLAAVSGYKDSKDNPNLAYDVNLNGTVNVLEYCRRAKAKMIFPSTYVYTKPYKEQKKETDKTGPTTDYAFTKYLGERLCRFYSRVFKVDTLILRTSNVYGLGQDSKYIVPIIVDCLMNNKLLELTRPDIERSYIFIDDVIEAYLALTKTNTKSGEVYNVGSNKATTLKDLVKILEKLSGKKLKLSYTGKSRLHDVPLNRFRVEKIKQKIGWETKISLEEGLKRYLDTLKN